MHKEEYAKKYTTFYHGGEKTMNSYLDYEINKELGECYLFMGEYEKAQEYYEKAASSSDAYAAPYMGLATIAVQKGELDIAYTHYQKALEREETDKTLTGLGLVAMSTENHDEAFSLFLRAIRLNPVNSVALSCLIEEAYLLQRVEEVLEPLEKQYEITQEINIRITLAGCLISLGRTAEAKEHLEEIIIIAPDNSNANDLYAYIAA